MSGNEVAKAIEEVNTRNIKTGIDYNNDTRRIVKECETKIEHHGKRIDAQNKVIALMEKSILNLQMQSYILLLYIK